MADEATPEYTKRPECGAVRVWTSPGRTFSVVKYDLAAPDGIEMPYLPKWWHCGYVRFPARFLEEPSNNGIVIYVPVHGGVTYAEEDEDDHSMVYGFDCNHSGDNEEDAPGKDVEWVARECEKMAEAIVLAATYEPRYLATEDSQARAVLLDEYHEELRRRFCDNEVGLGGSFGASINLLFGEL